MILHDLNHRALLVNGGIIQILLSILTMHMKDETIGDSKDKKFTIVALINSLSLCVLIEDNVTKFNR